MIAFISRRLAFILLVCVLIIFFTFLGMRMVENSEVRQPDFNLVNHTRAAWQESRVYLGSALRGDFGLVRKPYGLVSVGNLVQDAYRNSMGLLGLALLTSAVIGIPAGAAIGLARRGMWVLPVMLVTVFGISTPSFFAGLLLRQGELLYLRTFGRPLVSMAGMGWDFKHLLLPVLVLAARPLAYLTRAAFLAFNHVLDADYMRTAFSKGLRDGRAIRVHAVRNVSVPLLTALGVSLRFALSSLPIVEFFFVWPGLGLLMLESINRRQTGLVVTLALAMGLTFLLVNFFLDILYRWIDPRLRDPNLEAAG